MEYGTYFYNCIKEYINSINPKLYEEMHELISTLEIRKTQAQINKDLFWFLTQRSWAYDTLTKDIKNLLSLELGVDENMLNAIKENNNRNLCLTSTTLDTQWHSDFAKSFGDKLVQIEAQFHTVGSMFKDFCGFKIAWHERRLAL
jgi:hypothetical protein